MRRRKTWNRSGTLTTPAPLTTKYPISSWLRNLQARQDHSVKFETGNCLKGSLDFGTTTEIEEFPPWCINQMLYLCAGSRLSVCGRVVSGPVAWSVTTLVRLAPKLVCTWHLRYTKYNSLVCHLFVFFSCSDCLNFTVNTVLPKFPANCWGHPKPYHRLDP